MIFDPLEFLKTYFGLDVIDEYSGRSQLMAQMKTQLNQLAASLESGYKTYAAQTHTPIPTNSTELLENALQEASDKQSEFSRFLTGYSPFSTAKKVVTTRYASLSKATTAASKALSAANEANRQIEQKNAANAAAIDKANETARVAVEKANQAISSKVAQVNSLVDNINALDSYSNYTKQTSDTWKRDADKLINQATEMVKNNEKTQ